MPEEIVGENSIIKLEMALDETLRKFVYYKKGVFTFKPKIGN